MSFGSKNNASFIQDINANVMKAGDKVKVHLACNTEINERGFVQESAESIKHCFGDALIHITTPPSFYYPSPPPPPGHI